MLVYTLQGKTLKAVTSWQKSYTFSHKKRLVFSWLLSLDVEHKSLDLKCVPFFALNIPFPAIQHTCCNNKIGIAFWRSSLALPLPCQGASVSAFRFVSTYTLQTQTGMTRFPGLSTVTMMANSLMSLSSKSMIMGGFAKIFSWVSLILYPECVCLDATGMLKFPCNSFLIDVYIFMNSIILETSSSAVHMAQLVVHSFLNLKKYAFCARHCK